MMSTNRQLPRTTALLQRQLQEGLHIGAQLYASVGGQPVADVAMGEARPGVPMTPDTLMLWMSATKPVGAVAIAQLWEQHKLTLDDPIARHIPAFAKNGKEAITLRHILTHTSGIRWVETGWPTASWDQIIDKICGMRIERDWVPGKKAGYSAYVTWFLLGEIVRRLDGRDFADYARSEIFEPLGMNDCWIAMPPDVFHSYGTRIGIMHKTEGGTLTDMGLDTETACTHSRPSSGGRGPMRQLGRFYEMLLNGGSLNGRQIILPQTVEAMLARHRVGMFDLSFRHVLDWGLGFIPNSSQYGADTVPYGYARKPPAFLSIRSIILRWRWSSMGLRAKQHMTSESVPCCEHYMKSWDWSGHDLQPSAQIVVRSVRRSLSGDCYLGGQPTRPVCKFADRQHGTDRPDRVRPNHGLNLDGSRFQAAARTAGTSDSDSRSSRA
jgi:CubicO group peptidase (beta-lactamase class C family)